MAAREEQESLQSRSVWGPLQIGMARRKPMQLYEIAEKLKLRIDQVFQVARTVGVRAVNGGSTLDRMTAEYLEQQCRLQRTTGVVISEEEVVSDMEMKPEPEKDPRGLTDAGEHISDA